jgi:hypothetical protein
MKTKVKYKEGKTDAKMEQQKVGVKGRAQKTKDLMGGGGGTSSSFR